MTGNKNKKTLLFLSICLLAANACSAQDSLVIRFYDSLWQVTTPENAFYRQKFQRVKNYYSCFTFWARNNALYSKAYCLSAEAFPKIAGLYKSYYESGQLKDSVRYTNNGVRMSAYGYFETGQLSDSVKYDADDSVTQADYFYPDGKPFVHFSRNRETGGTFTEAFDTKGKILKEFVFSEPPSFTGTDGAWVEYLDKNINYAVPFVNDAPKGKYKVRIRFKIDENGEIVHAYALTGNGYGMEEEVIRVIKASPKWKPAIFLDRSISTYRIQPVTFSVID